MNTDDLPIHKSGFDVPLLSGGFFQMPENGYELPAALAGAILGAAQNGGGNADPLTPVRTMNINDYLAQQYPAPPCWALVADVYNKELSTGVTDYKTITPSIRDIAAAFRLALHKSPHGFSQIAAPVDLCVVLLGKTERMGIHHCGVFYQGSILHALESGTLYQDAASVGDEYELIEYWAKL
jgi:hypothetical protein